MSIFLCGSTFPLPACSMVSLLSGNSSCNHRHTSHLDFYQIRQWLNNLELASWNTSSFRCCNTCQLSGGVDCFHYHISLNHRRMLSRQTSPCACIQQLVLKTWHFFFLYFETSRHQFHTSHILTYFLLHHPTDHLNDAAPTSAVHFDHPQTQHLAVLCHEGEREQLFHSCALLPTWVLSCHCLRERKEKEEREGRRRA